MSFLRKLKSSKHFLKKGDTFLNNIEENTCFDLNQRDLIVYHIDSETEGTFSLTVKNDDIGDTVLDKVCDHYNLHDYKEYFGLKYTLVDETGDHEILWLDSMKHVGKQLKDTNNILTFRVKHFPGKPQNIESEYVRYLIFLQIRNYLLKGDLQLAFSDDIKLAAFAVQASLGDYDPTIHIGNYLADIKFLSRKSVKAEEKIMELHRHLQGKTPADMELAFLEKASQFDTYGAELIVVKTSKGVPINFGVSHIGIITYLHGTPANIAKIDMFPWNQIGKISYESRTLRVHFHTPDRENSEIIKKQVMVFKCSNTRVCKHLWKFVLDQKAFFNFKRGVDVPKIRSSSRLFTLKSKFRFSGRCERELIAAQSFEQSLCSSMGSNNTLSNVESSPSTAYNSLNRSDFNSTNTLVDRSFKRRTFMATPRSFVRPKRIDLQVSASPEKTQNDSNNNELKSNNNVETRLEDTQTLGLTKQLSTVDEKDSALSEKGSPHLNKSKPSENNKSDEKGLYVHPPAQATSTPQLTHKITNAAEFAEKRISDIAVTNGNQNDLNEQNLNKTSNSIQSKDGKDRKDTSLDDESEDEFFEHDHYLTKQKLVSETPEANQDENKIEEEPKVFYSEPNETVRTIRANISTVDHSKLKNLPCSLIIIFSIMFIFFFFLILIQHWKCTLSTESAGLINTTPDCNYQISLTRLSDTFQTMYNYAFGANVDQSGSMLDPIFQNFFNRDQN